MCEYCHFLENGDAAEDKKELIESDAELTLISDFEKDICNYAGENHSVKIHIETKVNPQVSIGVWRNELVCTLFYPGGGDIDTQCIEINYCPICGRKLKED